MLYYVSMSSEIKEIELKDMRQQVGISAREFARQLDTSHTNIINWEKAGWITKSEFIAPAANILGVTVEEILGLPKSRKNPIPGGKLGQAFEQANKLPRSKQDKVIALLDAFVMAHAKD